MIMSKTVADEKSVSVRLVALCGVLLLGALGGCGYKTMPVPPQEIVPAPITDLRYELDEKGVTLSWTWPARTVRGDTLTDLSEFLLYRAVVPADSYCETCPLPFGDPVVISGGVVSVDAQRRGTYKATLLRPGHLFFFKIRSRAGWWAESGDSNIVSFLWDMPPAKPADLTTRSGPDRIILSWAPVTTHMDGTVIEEPVAYQVYRSQGGGPFVPVGELQENTGFVDADVLHGRKYLYKVQAVTRYPKGRVGGGITAPVAGIPLDRTPAAAPAGVEGIRTATGVKIIWSAVPGDDVAGYRVYRRLAGEKSPTLIGQVKATTLIFDDPEPPGAESWFYSVSTVDRAEPANESARSPEVEVLP